MEETGVPGENHWHPVSHWQTLLHNIVSPEWEFELTTLLVIGTDCIGSNPLLYDHNHDGPWAWVEKYQNPLVAEVESIWKLYMWCITKENNMTNIFYFNIICYLFLLTKISYNGKTNNDFQHIIYIQCT